MSFGVAAVQTDRQNMSNWDREETTRSVKAVGAVDIPETSHFAKPGNEIQVNVPKLLILILLSRLNKIFVSPFFKTQEFGKLERVEIHYLSHALFLAYGACTYLQLIDENDNVECWQIVRVTI